MIPLFQKSAEEVLSKTRYSNNESEIKNLAEQMELVDQHSMSTLNQTLLQNAGGSGRNVPDFIAEHNFVADLIRNDPQGVFLYEPTGYIRPPDFVLPRESTTYFLQMKRLSDGEFDNRRNNMVRRIKTRLETIAVSKFVCIHLAEDFSEQDVEPLVSLIAAEAQKANESEYLYHDDICPKATFTFVNPNNSLPFLTLGGSADMNGRDLTDEAIVQIRASFDKAIGAFTWDNDLENVNLIVIEADQYDDSDLSQAVFGEEIYSIRGRTMISSLEREGHFYQPQYIDKLCGVIALRRVQSGSFITSYRKTLFINERFESYAAEVQRVLGIDDVITVDDC
ncbi:hypothetical protein [Paenibacillus anaericanus]|uniref:hypothetical protein n=1 Tax=Paenibacillus anaericanus TaxID=170367 RepID=UPI0027D86D3B|nr:hypothetical protein [Paenibacillus anaericanus]